MVPRRPAMATHKDLVIPKEPCSDTCVYHLNKSELELSDSQESKGTKFTRDQLNQLLALLPALETTGSSYCDAALVFAGPTCQEVSTCPFSSSARSDRSDQVAWELRAWRTKIMLQEDSKPIMDDHGQLVRIAPDQEEATPIEPGKCTSPSHGLFADRRRNVHRLQYSRYGLLYPSRPMRRIMSLCRPTQRMRANLPRTLPKRNNM